MDTVLWLCLLLVVAAAFSYILFDVFEVGGPLGEGDTRMQCVAALFILSICISLGWTLFAYLSTEKE